MPFQYINELLDLREVKIVNVEIAEDHATIELIPVDYIQNCPCCHSTSINRNGIPYNRDVRHLAAFNKSVNLRIPAICLACKDCGATFTWEYSFVEPKKRYTKVYATYLARQTYGATVAHTSTEQQVPYSTMERIFKCDLHEKSADIQEQVYQEALKREGLVLGVDDLKGRVFS